VQTKHRGIISLIAVVNTDHYYYSNINVALILGLYWFRAYSHIQSSFASEQQRQMDNRSKKPKN